MRILVLSYEFPPVGGGGGRAAKDICEKLVSRGHQVTLLTSHLHSLPKKEKIKGVSIVRVPCLRRKAYVATLLDMAGYVVASFFAGLDIIRKWKPEVMQVHFAVPTGPSAWALSRVFGLPYVLTVHLGDVPEGTPEKTRRWFRWIFPLTPPIWKNAAQVVAVSKFTRQLALKYYPLGKILQQDIRVIPNGVDTHTLFPGASAGVDAGVDTLAGSLIHPPRIVFAARFVPQKNPLQIVRVLAGLRELPWECYLLGDGPLHESVKAEIYAHGLEDRFTLTGWVTPDQVLEQYAQSDILFMPSLSEGFPLTGVQALAMGLAIVASRVGGFTELVCQGENGYLYDPADEDGMRAGLHALLSDPHLLLSMRKNSRGLSSRYDINLIVDEYEAIFRTIIQARTADAPEGEFPQP